MDSVLKITEENHYYPFGLKHNNYNTQYLRFRENEEQTSLMLKPPGGLDPPVAYKAPYNYKYQGQEWQDELGFGWYSYKYRNYDPAIVRFMVIDPLTEQYNTWAPYVFSRNRVVDARELEGLEPCVVTGRAFIPQKTLANPMAPVSSNKSFAGDNRNSYQVNTTAYRTEQKVRVDFANQSVTTLNNKANSTTGLDANGNVMKHHKAQLAQHRLILKIL